MDCQTCGIVIRLHNVWRTCYSGNTLKRVVEYIKKSKQVVNRGGNVTRVVHEQAEKELGRSNISFRNFLANLGKGEKPPQLSFEADSE